MLYLLLIILILNNFQIKYLKAATEYKLEIVAKDIDGNEISSFLDFTTKDGIFHGDLNLGTQNQINLFGEQGYVVIDGNLTIQDVTSNRRDISNLTPASNLIPPLPLKVCPHLVFLNE